MTPLFESPDESSHLQVIDYFARHRRRYPPTLPESRIATGAAMAESLRYHTPPLYYTPPLYHIVGAVLTAGITLDDLAARLEANPAWEMDWSPQRDADPWNKNVYLHLPGETWRESSTMRAALLLRVFSVGLGALTAWWVFASARVIFPAQPALALTATALVALNPQFIALSAGVTNDALSNAIFSLFVYLALRAMRDAAGWARWGGLGALVGVGMLTKQSALLLLPLGGLAILGQGAPGKLPPWRKILVDGAALGLTAALVGGSWYVLNTLRYGDPLGLQMHFGSQMPLPSFGLREARAVFETYWAGFGWALLSVPPWIYGVMALFVVAALAGMGRAVLPGGGVWHALWITRRGLALLVVLLGMNVVSLVRWALATGAPYGRLLFPSNVAIGILLAWGLAQWSDVRGWRWGRLGAVAGWLWLAVLVPGWILRPAFATPHVTRPLPTVAVPLDVHFVAGPTLLAYQITPPSASSLRPGDILRVTLYWQMEQAPLPRYTTWLQLSAFDPTQRIAAQDVWLGGTHYPTDFWRPGDVVRQQHRLVVLTDTVPFGLYWLRLGLVLPSGARALVTDAGDTVTLGPWRVRPAAVPAPAFPLDARLGEAMRLSGYDVTVDDSLTLTLTWQAQSMLPVDYAVFVHWVAADGTMLSQHDGPPAAGRYPTSWWLPGDVVPDTHTLPLPDVVPASITLRVGMYDPTTGARLPAYDAQGEWLPDGIVLLEIRQNG